MVSRIPNRSIWQIAIGIFALAAAIYDLPLVGQDFAFAYQDTSAGESADHDPEDTGDRGASDAVDDAEQAEAEQLTPAERAAALERRAGERVAGRPRGQANVLGMSLQEGEDGRVVVIDVAAASAAFDAGVRKGDVIVAFDGFQGESYRDWIDGMGRLVNDTPDGETMAVDLLRGGRQVAAQIRAPEERADDPRLPGLLGPQQQRQVIARAQGQSDVPLVPQPNQPLIDGSGSDIFIDNAPFSGAFNAAGANVNDRAMAEIFRLNPEQQTATGINENVRTGAQEQAAPGADGDLLQAQPQNLPQPEAPNSPSGSTGRIGVAGFRNNVDGLLVMIDIAGLEPGSYRVGIDDSGAVAGNQTSPALPTFGTVAEPAESPQSTTSDPRTDQSDIPPTGQARPLTTPPSGQARPLTTPPSGQARPLTTPPSGQARPLTSTPTGLPDTQQPGRVNTGLRQASPTTTLSHVGVLTVDQSGTGRMQQVVEGVQVADVLGQSIVIYAPAKAPQTAIPPDTGVSGVREGAGDPNVPAESQPTATRNVAGGTQPIVGDGQASQATQPIAAGEIRLLSDRRPAIGTTAPSTGRLDPQTKIQPNQTEPVERAALPQPPTR